MLHSVQLVLRHRADSKADRPTRATFAPDQQTYRALTVGCTNILQGYDQECESNNKKKKRISCCSLNCRCGRKYDIQKVKWHQTPHRNAMRIIPRENNVK